MTTNRMGLDQALSDERLELFISKPLDNGLTRGEQMELVREALARRKASKELVAWTTGDFSQNIGCNFGEKKQGEAPCIIAVYWDYKTFRHHTDCDEISDKWLQEAIKNTGAKPLYSVTPLQAVTVPMKDHQIRELVNDLRDIAVKYHGTQQLRERIARAVRSVMLKSVTNEP